MPADWSQAFDDPIPLPDGRELRTLREAGDYILALTGKTRQSKPWQIATRMLLTVAEGRGPLMFADIGMRRAIHHGRPAPEKPPRRKRAKAFRLIR